MTKMCSSVFSGFEVAFLDLQARTLGTPLVELLGGAVRNKVAYSAYLFYKWDASVDPEYAPDPYGEAVNPAQIVAQAKKMIDQYGLGVELDQTKLAELHQAFLTCRIRTRNDVTQMQKFRPDWSTVKPRF